MRSHALIAAVVAAASATRSVSANIEATSNPSSTPVSASTSFTTTTVTSTSVVATSTVTTTVGTATMTVPTPAGFIFVQSSLPNATYGGSGGGSPVNAQDSATQHAVRRDNLEVRASTATTGAVITKTVTKNVVTQVTTTTTKTVASTTSTVWAACATNNFADHVGNRTIVDSSGDSNAVQAYRKATNAYECCAIAMSKPGSARFLYLTATSICYVPIFNVAQQCPAQNGRGTAQLGSGAPVVVGNGYCGKIQGSTG